MRTRTPRIIAATTLAAGLVAPLATTPADAASTARTTAAWSNGILKSAVTGRTIAKSDIGRTITVQLGTAATSGIDCKTVTLAHTPAGSSARKVLMGKARTISCTAATVKASTKVTAAMVGGSVDLAVRSTPVASKSRFVFNGQVVLGTTQKSNTTVQRPVAPAVRPTVKPSVAPSVKPVVTPTPTVKPTATVTPTATAKPTATATPTATAAPSTNPLAGTPRVAWEGGPSYWSRFPDTAKGGWTNPNFFPVALWWGVFSNDAEVKYDKSMGINTYIVTNKTADYRLLENNAMGYIGHQLDGMPRSSKAWVGDFLDDEVDGRFSATEGHQELTRLSSQLPDHNKMRYSNYTGMVISWTQNNPTWAKAANGYVNNYSDAVSIDSYWYSSPYCDWEVVHGQAFLVPFDKANCRTGQAYGRTTKALRQQDATDGKLQPVWNFVENIDVAPDGKQVHALKPAEVKAMAMSSIINEARGLLWFNNSFGGPCSTGNAIRETQVNPSYACADTVKAMGEVNRFVQSLAPVLNTQSYYYTWGTGVETMTKYHGGSVYLFAMPTDSGANSGAGTKTFTAPRALAGHKVTVVGENRTLPVTADGTFTDHFASLETYHVYQIA